MNKSESKYFNTARLMDEALLTLLDKKDFAYVTVTEICKKAGVNRSTFYLHYERMTDLLAESIEYLKCELRRRYQAEDGIDVANGDLKELLLFTPEFSLPYLQFLKEHRKAFMAVISNPILFRVDEVFDSMFEKLFEPILERFCVPRSERTYIVKFYNSGIHAIIIEWLKRDCADEMSFIADLIVKCVNHRL